MASSTRFSSTLARRSIVARMAALLALVACGVAIYLVVMAFTENEGGGDSKNDKKGRSEQSKHEKQAQRDELHGRRRRHPFGHRGRDRHFRAEDRAPQSGPRRRDSQRRPDPGASLTRADRRCPGGRRDLGGAFPRPSSAAPPKPPASLPASSWILVDAESGDVLAAHDPKTAYPIASATKLMTYYVAAEQLRPGPGDRRRPV